MFVEIPKVLLASIATDSDRMPKLYYHPIAIGRKFFWLRLRTIYSLMNKYVNDRNKCLDFGCGSGVFLPTLSGMFISVTGIDIEMEEAELIVDHYNLNNVQLISGDINTTVLDESRFDAISAADVLEHFKELDAPVSQIYRWLKDDGILITSLPTENLFTKCTRIIGRYEKPFDHYHTGEQVEGCLQKNGFYRVKSIKVISLFPLYLVSVWRKKI